MSIFSKVWGFIKSLVTRSGLNDFLKSYQSDALAIIERLADVHSGEGLHQWWDEAFAEMKAKVQADTENVKDNWLSLSLSLAYEVFKGEKEKEQQD